jgi:hypothetical protein
MYHDIVMFQDSIRRHCFRSTGNEAGGRGCVRHAIADHRVPMLILRTFAATACLALVACGEPNSQPAANPATPTPTTPTTPTTPAAAGGASAAAPKPGGATATAPVAAGQATDDRPAAPAAAEKTGGGVLGGIAPLQLDANSSGNVLRPEVNLKIGELARVLGGVKDKASALLAKPKLEALIAEFGNLKAGGKLEVPPNVFVAIDSLSRHFEVGPVLGNTLDALRAALQ